jgi:hypothetical protein
LIFEDDSVMMDVIKRRKKSMKRSVTNEESESVQTEPASNNSIALAHVVGLIIGSPEFQRK